MIAVRHPRIAGGILIALILLSVVVFRHSYRQVNDPKTAFRVKEMAVSYGQQEIEVNGVLLTVEKPQVEKYFSEEYNQDVVMYKVPFEAHNISEDEVDFDETNLQLISAGRVHVGWPQDSHDDEEAAATNWGALKPGEITKGYWRIEAVIDGMPEEAYRDYALYFLQNEGDALFKFRFEEE